MVIFFDNELSQTLPSCALVKLVDGNACWVIKATLGSTQWRWFSYMAVALPWSRPCHCKNQSKCWSQLQMSAMRVNIHHQRDEGGQTEVLQGLSEGQIFLFTSSRTIWCIFSCRCADDRLVSILRHHSFLKELQEIALRGESSQRRTPLLISEEEAAAYYSSYY